MGKTIFLLVLLALFAQPVLADCEYNGKTYPEGTVIGPYVCKDGKWVRK